MLAGLGIGCGAAPVGGPAPSPPEPGLSIAATVDPIAGEVRIRYTLHAPGALPPRTRIAFPSEWAGRDDLGDDVVRVRASDHDGVPLPARFDDSGVLVVSSDGADTIVLEYAVRPTRSLLVHATRFRAVMSSARFYAPGLALLAVPLDLGEALTASVRFSCDAPAGDEWLLRSTVDTDEPVPLRSLIDAAWFAGRFERIDRRRGDRAVTLWLDRQLPIAGQALADLVLSVVEAQAPLLGDAVARRTVAVALLREDDPDVVTGGGRAGGFVLELGARVDATDPEVAELVAHENFHRLNGHLLRYAAVDEYATMWFREGVTDYVALRNASDAGVLPTQRFFRSIGRALATYLGSPVGSATVAEVGVGFWSDRDLQRLPYDKGALLGLLIDLRLRETGEHSLDGYFVHLRDEVGADGVPLTNTMIRESLERYSGVPWGPFFDDYVLGGETLPVFERLNRAGLDVVERIEPAPYFGFRASVTVEGDWFVSFVEAGSPADRAGVHVGMRLRGEPYVPTTPGAAEATLEALTDRGSRTISIGSGRGQRRAFALIATDDGYLGAFGLEPIAGDRP